MTATAMSSAQRSNRIAWFFLFGLLAIDLAWLPFTQVRPNPLLLLLPLSAAAALVFAAHLYRDKRAEFGLADGFDCAAQVTVFSAFVVLLSYLAATLGFPLQDAALYRADNALGFDWLAYAKAVDQLPALGMLFNIAYKSFTVQLLVVPLLLSFLGRGQVARSMVLATILAGAVTTLISGVVPAMAMFVHLGLGPADFPNLPLSGAFVHVDDMPALRAGTPFELHLGAAVGIVTFPSFHAAGGLLLLLAGLSHPVLRWPLVILNLALIAATPIDGGHYFVDVGAGLALASLCHLLARRIMMPAADGHREPALVSSAVAIAKS